MELENRYSDIDLCWRFIIPSPTPLHLGVCMYEYEYVMTL